MEESAPRVAHRIDAYNVAILVGNEVLRRGLEAVLQSLHTVRTVQKCTTRDGVAAFLESRKFDFLITTTFDVAWLEGVSQQLADARTKVLMLVDESSTRDLFKYAPNRVNGFLSQHDLTADTLHDALHRCSLGHMPISPALTRRLLAQAEESTRPQQVRTANLTSREKETLALLVKGMSNKQIARRLGISSHGAKRLVASIMLKLDSPNRTTAAVNALKAGIIDDQCVPE